MIGTFFAFGVLSLAFCLCLAVSEGMIEGTVRRLTSHRCGLAAYHEARKRAMLRPESTPVDDDFGADS